MTVEEEIGGDAEELAKAIVRSMLEEPNISSPGEATTALIMSSIGGLVEDLSGADASEEWLEAMAVKATRAAVVVGCVAQIAASVIRGAKEHEITIGNQLEPLFDFPET